MVVGPGEVVACTLFSDPLFRFRSESSWAGISRRLGITWVARRWAGDVPRWTVAWEEGVGHL